MTTCSMSVSFPPQAEGPEEIMELPLPAAQPWRNVDPNSATAMAPPSFNTSRRETLLRDNEILSWIQRRREHQYNVKFRRMLKCRAARKADAVSAQWLRNGCRDR